MLVFVAGWNISPKQKSRVVAALTRAAAGYKTIDTSALYAFTPGSGAFVYALGASDAATAPSVPLWRAQNRMTVVAGAVVDPAGRFDAQNAKALAHNMNKVTNLEGQFVAVDATAESMTITNDAYGVYQVFYAEQDGSCLISNNATMLANILDISEFDALGVSSFIGSSLAMSNRTLIKGVTVMPGGQQWMWSPEGGLRKQTYYHYAQLAHEVREPLSDKGIARIAQDLADQMSQLGKQTQSLKVPITAGRDTRVMVALALQNNPDADYFSVGDASRDDVKVGRIIADRYNLRHENEQTSIEAIVSDWSTLAERVVQRNDGLVTLEHIRNAVDKEGPGHIPTMLYGAGGEIARGYYHNARTCFTNPSPRYLTTLLHDEMVGYDGMLLTPTAHQEVKGYLVQFVTDTLSTGFAASDVPDVFFLNEIVRRWAGSQFRQEMHNFRVFSPFCTRPYVEAAFRLAPYHRVMESLPLTLIKHINPELFEIPFDKPLMPQTKAALRQKMLKQQLKEDAKTLLRKAKLLETLRKFKNYQADSDPKLSKANERIYWLEQVSEHMRTFCLDHSSSRLWDYIAREDFELVMKKENTVLRVHNLRALYNIMTVFYYEQYQKSLLPVISTISPEQPQIMNPTRPAPVVAF